jgi:hypothetical protein
MTDFEKVSREIERDEMRRGDSNFIVLGRFFTNGGYKNKTWQKKYGIWK